MLADPVSGRFITADNKPITDPFVGWRNAAIMSGHWLLHGVGMFVVEEKSSGEFVGRVGPWLLAGLAGLRSRLGYLRALSRQGLCGGRGAEGGDRLVVCNVWNSMKSSTASFRENTASQGVARRHGAEKGRQFDLFGHVADVWVTRRGKWPERAASSKLETDRRLPLPRFSRVTAPGK